MTSDDRALQHLERANPVPEGPTPSMSAAQFLAQIDRPQHQEQPIMLTKNHLADHAPRPAEGDRRSRPLVTLLTAAAVVALVVSGLVYIGTRDDRDEIPTSPVPTTVPTTVPTVDETPTSQAPTTETTVDADSPIVPIVPIVPSDAAEPVPGFGSSVVPGTYWSFVLGVDIEFDVPRTMFVAANELGSLGLIDGYDAQTGQYTPDTGLSLAFRRLAGWSTREEAVSRTALGSIDPYDLDAWVADNDVALLSDTTTEISGHPTRVVDVQVDPESTVQGPEGPNGCFAGWEPCFHYGLTAPRPTARKDWVSAQRVTRFYLITIDGSEPVLVEVGAPSGSDFFAEVESTVIASLILGDDGPSLP